MFVAAGFAVKAWRLTDVDVAERREALPEGVHLRLVGLDLVPVLILGRALLLNVEAQVLQQHHGAALGLVDEGLDLGPHAVGRELHRLAEQALELGHDGLEAVLGVGGPVGAAEVRHEDHGLGAGVDGVLDGGKGADDALVVGDLLALEGHVEVDLRVSAGH